MEQQGRDGLELHWSCTGAGITAGSGDALELELQLALELALELHRSCSGAAVELSGQGWQHPVPSPPPFPGKEMVEAAAPRAAASPSD